MLNLILNTGGLESLFKLLISNYVTWIFLAVVVVIVIKDAFTKGIRQVIIDVVVAVIVAVIVFGANMFFGENGLFTKTGTDIAKEVANTIGLY
jgi:uncharacterized membrane protein YwaF